MSAPLGPRTLQELEANIIRVGELNGKRGELIKQRDQLVVQQGQLIASAATHGARAVEYYKSADAHAASAAVHGAKADALRASADAHLAKAAQLAKLRALLLAAPVKPSSPSLAAKGSQASVIPTSVVSAHSVASQSLISAH